MSPTTQLNHYSRLNAQSVELQADKMYKQVYWLSVSKRWFSDDSIDVRQEKGSIVNCTKIDHSNANGEKRRKRFFFARRQICRGRK